MIKPLNDAHSIRAVALVLEFPTDVDSEGLAFIKAESKRFRSKLNMRTVLRRMGIQLPMGNKKSEVQEGETGYRYSARNSDGTDLKWFEVANRRTVFCTNEYTDFNSFWAEAVYFLDVGCKAFGDAGLRPEKLILEYRDEFLSESVDWEPTALFNLDSGYLARHAVRKGQYWNSHYGYYDELDGRLSVNAGKINHSEVADDYDDTRMSQVNITLTHGVALEPGVDWKALVPSLRQVHRQQFTDILSEEMLGTIGLETGS